jgi:hypothetical protein
VDEAAALAFLEEMEVESAPKRTEVQGQEKPAEGEGRGPGIRLPAGQRCCQTVASGGWGRKPPTKNGASEGIRTLDTHVGNVMLYQAELRSLPSRFEKVTRISLECKQGFSES